MSVCVSSLSVKRPFFLFPSLTQTRSRTLDNGRNLNISPSPPHISFTLTLCSGLFFSLSPLISHLICPPFSALSRLPHHTGPFHRVSVRCIYYRGLVCECQRRVRVKVTCLCITPFLTKQSLTLSSVYGVVSSCLLTCIL